MESALSDALNNLVPLFLPSQSLLAAEPLGDGNINDTYLIRFSGSRPAVLQRINGDVFPDPVGVADNVKLVTDYIREKQEVTTTPSKTLEIVPSVAGASHVRDADGQIWRMAVYIGESESLAAVTSLIQAYQGGKLLGWFHCQLSTFDTGLLTDPLPGFHDLPGYYNHYERVKRSHQRVRSPDLSYCCQEVEKRAADMDLLQKAARMKKTQVRAIHGDPKVGNVLFKTGSKEAVALIDLDTVSAGLLHYDIGDALRSFCNPAGEKTADPEEVSFDLEICSSLLNGYCAGGMMVDPSERRFIYQGVRLMTLELAVRFLADYLAGDRYFKVSDEQENLRRALVQLHLLHSIEKQQGSIEAIAAKLP